MTIFHCEKRGDTEGVGLFYKIIVNLKGAAHRTICSSSTT